ncbi:hypothetical protein [Bacillus velezensis]|uniref:hypothetical protein n=1 Tax=Bacillus TaxID=1386 RepID=UPI0005E96640|nr:hypothetical protein [Bacillus velezensis]KJD56673.1 hypothetical protein UZ38_16280 [Bacillus amyloliquefaciens]MDQ8054990.1 hypothetical protein [Bacillus velezensis]OQV54096.1 hypothetical protein B5Z21_01675 [Bacillus velezensis]WHM03104.1 hypothetical protein QLX50_06005 [Bacillus velezensis]
MVLFNWLSQNKEWVFSGAGLTIIAFAFNLFKKKNKSEGKRFIQESGDNSVNIQGESVKVGNITPKQGEDTDA